MRNPTALPLKTLLMVLACYAVINIRKIITTNSSSATKQTIAYYNNRSDGFRRTWAPVIDLITKHTSPNTHPRVIDIGCGPGMTAHLLAEKGHTVLCVDPAENMLKACAEKGLKTYHSTWQNFPAHTGQYDLALAISSFIHIPHNEWFTSLKKVAQLLTKNGIFIIAFFEGQGEEVVNGWLEKASLLSKNKQTIYFTTQQAFESLLPASLHVLSKTTHPVGPRSSVVYALKKQ